MRLFSLAFALASSLLAAPIAAPSIGGYGGLELDVFPGQRRGKGRNNRRGRGKRNPPKNRANRLTIGKRVRRKHRRCR